MENENENVRASAMAALYAALSKAQGEFTALAKNREVEISMKTGGRYKFRYADLEAAIGATRPALAANGLSVFQRIAEGQLVTTVAHKDGGTIESSVKLSDGFGDIKQYGANITYLRRYAYCAILCISADDDLDENGEEVGAQSPAPQRPTTPEQLPPYEQQQLETNLPTWAAMIAEGKVTPAAIIKKISARNVLSPEQVGAIMALANKGEKQ